MKRLVVLFALLSIAGCAVSAGSNDVSASQSSQPTGVSCVTQTVDRTSCNGLTPTESTQYSCEDGVASYKCTSDYLGDNGGPCSFTSDYTRWTISTDCATYEAQNPDMFGSN